jgi:hypothetical protein
LIEQVERDGPGRRDYDKLKCPNCDILWSNLERERQSTKEHVCGKIREVKEDVATIFDKINEQSRANSTLVPRWMFLTAFGALITAAGWWFSTFSTSLEKNQKEIKETVTTIHRRISETDNNRESLKDSMTELKWSVNALSTRISEVEKKLPK